MKKLENNKLEGVVGGAASIGIFGGIILAVTTISVFISGVLEGFTHPRGCNE
ncbi:MAG: hypothetical protein IKO49_07510 [Bacilli bacterium]|nr:hypothetical protein [Bacilli bacterium]